MDALFTVIICFQNPEIKYLETCIDSLCKQKYKNFNCIFVNDGSNNINYLSIIKSKIKGVNFYYHENKINLGLGISRNIGIELATGNYILFLDVDDFISIDCLKYLSEKIYQNNDLDLICFDYMEIYGNNFESKNKLVKQKNIKEEIFSNAISKKMLKYLFDKFQTDWRYCYNRNFLIKNNIFHKNEKIYFEDVIFNLQCKNNFKKILCTNKKIYFYNRNNLNSIVRNFNSKESAQLILNNIFWIYQLLRTKGALNENFFFYVLYFFRQFILINENNQNWIFLKELSLKNKFISLKFLSFKTWFICKFLVLSKKMGKKISNIVAKRDAKLKKQMIINKIAEK